MVAKVLQPLKTRQSKPLPHAATKRDLINRLFSPVNESIYSFKFNSSTNLSSACWFYIYCRIVFSFLPTVSTKYPLIQNFRFSNLYFIFARLSNIIHVLLLVKYPINSDTVYISCLKIALISNYI